MKKELKRRIKEIKEKLEENKIECFLVLNPKNLFYLTGKWYFAGIGLLEKDNFSIFSITSNLEKNTKEYNLNKIKQLLSKYKKVYIDRNIELERYLNFKKVLKKQLIPSSIIEEIRMYKSTYEINCIKASSKITIKGIYFGKKKGKGMKELELIGELERFYRRMGGEGFFEEGIIIAGDRNTRNIHHFPTNNRICNYLLIDAGVKIKGYFSDITRTFLFKKDKKIKECIEFIENLQFEIKDFLEEEKEFRKGEEFVKKKLEKEGFKKYHSVFHGVGLEVHERLPKEIEENIVFVIEPGAYTKKFGVRKEDVFVVKGGKIRTILPQHKLLLN